MLTYLLIFLSALLLAGVFVHRAIVVLVKKPELEVVEKEDPKEEAEKKPKKRLSKGHKSDIEKLYKRALAQIKKGLPKEAVKTLVGALALDPNSEDCLRELGELYLAQKMWGKASACYKHLTELKEDAVYFSHLGLAFYNAGELPEAAEAYQKAITLDPKRKQRYISLCNIYRDAEKPQLAIIAINKAIELDAENVDYLLLAADTHIDLEDYAAAKQLCDDSKSINPMSKMANKIREVAVAKERKAKAEAANNSQKPN